MRPSRTPKLQPPLRRELLSRRRHRNLHSLNQVCFARISCELSVANTIFAALSLTCIFFPGQVNQTAFTAPSATGSTPSTGGPKSITAPEGSLQQSPIPRTNSGPLKATKTGSVQGAEAGSSLVASVAPTEYQSTPMFSVTNESTTGGASRTGGSSLR